MHKNIFTSESVSEGHPDKICDQVADAILDACLKDDSESKVACEAFTTTGMILIGGEITTNTYIDFDKLVRDVVRNIGYTHSEYGLDAESMAILNTVHSQSPDIAQGLTGAGLYAGEQGAGDQGMMFGFACRETKEMMPAPLIFSHKILRLAARLRKEKTIAYLRPDAKSQVTIEYENGSPKRIAAVVLSHQHDPQIAYADISHDLIEFIIKPALADTDLLDKDTKYFINPTGRFVIGGPHGDSGLTGRKIVVDTYGGMGHHGGGSFSGKDPSKVDRSAAYMARYVAKNVVAAELCDRCEIEFAYAIGVPFPISVSVDTMGTAKVPELQISKAIQEVFDLSPRGIIDSLELKRPIFFPSASYGHFGRPEFSWEQSNKILELQKAIG